MSQMKKIDSLTGLRFVFMMMIVTAHLEFCGGVDEPNVYDYMFHNARMAVNYFFMISGFGLTYKCFSTRQPAVTNLSGFNCVKYACRRVRKIYPLFLITSFMMIPRVLELVAVLRRSITAAVSVYAPRFALLFTLTQSLTGKTKYSHLFNGAGWFLSAIFVLYIIYPLIERFNLNYISKKPYCALVITFAAGCMCRFLMKTVEGMTGFNDLVYGSPYSRVFDFLIGIILCDIYYDRKEKQKGYGTKEEVFISCITIGWWLFRNCVFYGEYYLCKEIIDRIIVMGVIYIFAMSKGKISRFLSSRKMVFLGSVSMYIYLIHYCVRIDAEWILERHIDNRILINILSITAIVGVTTLWIFVIEKIKKRKV